MMIKVYLLLRNNKQSGPYSLEEIAGQQLKPLDLIWVEGKSAAWKYASEVSELAQFLPGSHTTNQPSARKSEHDAYLPKARNLAAGQVLPPSSANKIHVSLPANASARKQPAADKTVQAVPEIKPVAQRPVQDPLPLEDLPPVRAERAEPLGLKEKLVTNYKSSLEEKEEAYTEWIYKTKSRKNSLAPEWIGGIAVVVLLLMGSAAYYIKNKSGEQPEIVQATTGDGQAVEELTSTQPVQDPTPQPETPSSEETLAPVSKTPAATPPPNSNTVYYENSKPATAAKTLAKQPLVTKTPDKTKAAPVQGEVKPGTVAVKEESAPQIVEEATAANAPKTSKTSAPEAESVKTKKTFSEKVDGFFNKIIRAKKVEPGVPAGSPEPASTEGERKVIRRGETPAPSSEAPKRDLSEGVQVTTIEPSNTWMQGVHGLRMKVENKNDVRVSNATVEVRYLNDQNAVIEKKTIRLNAIAPGKQVTMDIPDHRLADHATATLVSASN